MKIYQCPRCNYSTHILTIYIRHLKRKKICEPILSKTNLQKEYMKYDIKDKLILTQNTTLKTTKNVELHKIPQNTTKINQCKYCDKVFSRIDSLTRHYKTCKDKKRTDEANFHMTELVKLLNDKDEKLYEEKKELRFPLCSCVFYPVADDNLVGGQLMFKNQVVITPKRNRLVVFSPGLYHGVQQFRGKRTSININPWIEL